MDSCLVAIVGLVCLYLGYRFYGRYLAHHVLCVDDSRTTPARRLNDDHDYVPTRPAVLFGHHFASIAGLGPLVGPALAVIWGWLPAALWIVFGSIFAGAVHDMTILAVSVRHEGRSIGEATSDIISNRGRNLFLVLIFFVLALAMGVFVLVITILFTGTATRPMYPQSVIPVFALIGIAMIIGWLTHRKGVALGPATVVGVALMLGSIVVGCIYPIASVSASTWKIVLLAYAFLASILPVWLLLQPRDYLNSFELYIGFILLYAGLFVTHPSLKAPAINTAPSDLPSMMPFLFITLACGAVSGFHSLVSSGTTAKQLDRERDILPIGYGSMLTEGALGLIVLLACAAGVASKADWHAHYASWAAAQGLGAKLDAFIHGGASFMAGVGIPEFYGRSFIAVFAVSFAMTTLDSATRLLRYNVEEIGRSLNIRILRNAWIASGLAVSAIGYFAFMTIDGRPAGMVLWQLFGVTNQLLAALGLLVVTVYLKQRRRPTWVSMLPLSFLFAVAGYALCIKLWSYGGNVLTLGWASPVLHVFIVGLLILVIALWLMAEAAWAFLFKRDHIRDETCAPVPSPTPAP